MKRLIRKLLCCTVASFIWVTSLYGGQKSLDEACFKLAVGVSSCMLWPIYNPKISCTKLGQLTQDMVMYKDSRLASILRSLCLNICYEAKSGKTVRASEMLYEFYIRCKKGMLSER